MTSRSPQFATCYLFVDGAYVRQRRADMGLDVEFDPRGPAKGYLEHHVRILGRKLALVRCFYFDAPDEKDRRSAEFIEKLRGLDDTHV